MGLFAALVGVCGADGARAEDKSAVPRSSAGLTSPIALIDIQHVLDHDPEFLQRKNEFEAGAALAEAAIRQRKDEIGELSRRLKGLQTGSAEHTELDLRILRRGAELRAQIERTRKKLAAGEAKLYVAAYREIVRAVERHLDETDFRLVLRIDAADEGAQGAMAPHGDPPPAASAVVAQRGVDITPDILRRLDDGRRLHVDESLRDSSRLGETRPRER